MKGEVVMIGYHTSRENYIITNNLQVGNDLMIPHDIYGDIPFVVIGKNHDAPDTVTVLSKDIIRLLPFDARECANPDSAIRQYGNNRYDYSNLLQWLNSDKSTKDWYTDQHLYDQSPVNALVVSYTPYLFEDGFLRGFSDTLKSQLASADKFTVKSDKTSDIVTSKVFLLSATEVGLGDLSYNDDLVEGEVYEYFNKPKDDNMQVAYPSDFCIHNIGTYDIGFINKQVNRSKNHGWYWWTRTHLTNTTGHLLVVNSDGALAYAKATSGYIGVRPAMVIKNYV